MLVTVDPNTAPDPADGLTPEQCARYQRIDPLLRAAGWDVQNLRKISLRKSVGVAVREYPLGKDAVDYLLFVDGKAIGTIEAKAQGLTLSGVETQSRRYTDGFSALPDAKRPKSWLWPERLPFHYITTGDETLFESLRDPRPRTREVFGFHRPEWLRHLAEKSSLRQGIHNMPPLIKDDLRKSQIDAIGGLEASVRDDRPRALVEMTMGGGKTIAAVAHAYRLLSHAGAQRILFLVDRRGLAQQAVDEFTNWQTPEGRKFGELFVVQRLTGPVINEASNVVVTTIQRLYAMLQGNEDFDETREDVSAWELDDSASPQLEVAYQSKVPIETFDYIFIDECHRSIYGRWGQVLDYFDAFQTGLSATPAKQTYGYFSTNVIDGSTKPNVVSRYTHDESVLDGVNVDFKVFRIKTQIGETGSTISGGEWIKLRDKRTRKLRAEQLDEDFEYDAAKVNTAVVAEDQLRTVVRAFKDNLPTMFPGRETVPKTVVFCRDDTHAEDVVKVIREEFAEGSDFARKITYLTGNSQQAIQDFRTDPRFRIAVSVDQISTGTDIKAVECLLFLRNVKSRLLFEQMKGRGVRTIQPADLRAVTGDATAKTHFVLVDAVGVTDSEQAWVAAPPLDREPSIPLTELLGTLAQGVDHDDLLTTVASRLSALAGRLTGDEEAAIKQMTGGEGLRDIARSLVQAVSPERQLDLAHDLAQAAGEPLPAEPTTDEEQALVARYVEKAREQLVHAATEHLADGEVRETILAIQRNAEQVIDRQSVDAVLGAEFVDDGKAKSVVESWEKFVEEHHDEYVALAAHYGQPQKRRLSYDDIKALSLAISVPPHNLTPTRLWEAYAALEKTRVRGSGERKLVDLVSIIRFTTEQADELEPLADLVRLRYDLWLEEQSSAGRSFTPEQRRWLDMVADQIATSLSIEKQDFDEFPFRDRGGLIAAHRAFAGGLDDVLAELNEKLARA